ncbi:hypothetical protein K435DRAFT_973646 [Dendrothele bispora CBS 962.96]|uniref:Uncharacterized protein n=1 Tax=Dendrothele bispora (strain CBS 962.96) TaxID=1314807 RepID=A0A4S8KQZ9_DENBC|nr:hypothetical protein K435DRAFT_973646 [Dendrothele bispora CBS 962.96]
MRFSFLRTTLLFVCSAAFFTDVTKANPVSVLGGLAERDTTTATAPQTLISRVQGTLNNLESRVNGITPQIDAVINRPAQPNNNGSNGGILEELQSLVNEVAQAINDATGVIDTILSGGGGISCSAPGVNQACQQIGQQITQIIQQITEPFTPYLNNGGNQRKRQEGEDPELTQGQVQGLLNPLNNPISGLLEAVFGILDGLLYIVDNLLGIVLYVLNQLAWDLVYNTLQL